MKKLINNYKEKFGNRKNSSYIGLKVAGLIVLAGILGFFIYLILGETVFAAELSNTAYTAVLAADINSSPVLTPEVFPAFGG